MRNTDWNTVLKHLAWITCVMVALQVIFFFVFQIIDYSSFSLSVTLTAAVLVVLTVLLVWKALKQTVSKS